MKGCFAKGWGLASPVVDGGGGPTGLWGACGVTLRLRAQQGVDPDRRSPRTNMGQVGSHGEAGERENDPAVDTDPTVLW